MKLNPYLNFNGNCEAAFKFYEQVLGGKMEAMMNHEGTPAMEHIPAEWAKKIMHARINVGGTILMGSDSPPQYQSEAHGFCVSLLVDTPAEAERVFAALSENGQVEMPLEETFWATRFGMLKDQFGTPWMVNCEKPM
ncbi:MAG: VOC family protein [Armatimonadota bacterium]|nr:VOC family protein [Armatimonadota bacterium]